jgi:hypothetical protein
MAESKTHFSSKPAMLLSCEVQGKMAAYTHATCWIAMGENNQELSPRPSSIFMRPCHGWQVLVPCTFS